MFILRSIGSDCIGEIEAVNRSVLGQTNREPSALYL